MRLVLVVMLTAAATAAGQPRKAVPTATGVLYRYSGDTIWRERDTTVVRTIYRGDTVVTDRWVGERRMHEATYLLIGDSARLLSSVDSAGRRVEGGPRLVPAMIVSASRRMLESHLRMPRRNANHVPFAPPMPISYCIDRSRNIVQHADTARDIRVVGGRTDTTTYVFVGDTTVKRLPPRPATFGYAMYTTLIGEMHMSVVHRTLASRNSSLPALPGRSTDGCNPG